MIPSLFLGMVCQFSLDDAIIWLPNLHDHYFRYVHAHTSLHYPVLAQLPSISYSAVHNRLSLSLSLPWLLPC
jgi:hypothetical protein